jgi:hypothetical protein
MVSGRPLPPIETLCHCLPQTRRDASVFLLRRRCMPQAAMVLHRPRRQHLGCRLSRRRAWRSRRPCACQPRSSGGSCVCGLLEQPNVVLLSKLEQPSPAPILPFYSSCPWRATGSVASLSQIDVVLFLLQSLVLVFDTADRTIDQQRG